MIQNAKSDRLDRDRQRNGDNNLDCVMRGDAQRAVVVDLVVRVGVGDLEDTREQHKGDADNPYKNNEGTP